MERQVMLVCEDKLGEAVLLRLLREMRPNMRPLPTQLEGSNTRIFANMAKYARASRAGIPHAVLTDLDHHTCAPSYLTARDVPMVPGLLHFRIAVREVEAWLMADRQALAAFLEIPVAKITMTPENEPDPKQTLMNLVRKSPNRNLRREILTDPGSLASKGILYNERWSAFVLGKWDPGRAAKKADSLDRTMLRMASL